MRRCWGGQPRKTTAAGVYRAPARRQLPRRRNLEIRRRSPRVQQSSDHYMYVKILLNARGKNSQTGLDKSIQCSQKAKNIACSYQSAWKKKSDFSGHWAEYSLTFSLSSEKYSRLRANAAPDTPYESENGPGELKLFK